MPEHPEAIVRRFNAIEDEKEIITIGCYCVRCIEKDEEIARLKECIDEKSQWKSGRTQRAHNRGEEE